MNKETDKQRDKKKKTDTRINNELTDRYANI